MVALCRCSKFVMSRVWRRASRMSDVIGVLPFLFLLATLLSTLHIALANGCLVGVSFVKRCKSAIA